MIGDTIFFFIFLMQTLCGLPELLFSSFSIVSEYIHDFLLVNLLWIIINWCWFIWDGLGGQKNIVLSVATLVEMKVMKNHHPHALYSLNIVMIEL